MTEALERNLFGASAGAQANACYVEHGGRFMDVEHQRIRFFLSHGGVQHTAKKLFDPAFNEGNRLHILSGVDLRVVPCHILFFFVLLFFCGQVGLPESLALAAAVRYAQDRGGQSFDSSARRAGFFEASGYSTRAAI